MPIKMQCLVICSNMGALPELVEDGQTGFVVEARNLEQIKDRMTYYIKDKKRIIPHGGEWC